MRGIAQGFVLSVLVILGYTQVAIPARLLDDRPLPVIKTLPADTATDPDVKALCPGAAPGPVSDGQPIVVTLPPAVPFTVGDMNHGSWRQPPVADPTWRLQYQSLMWVPPLAIRAARDGQLASLTNLVDQVVQFHQHNPDPKRQADGWDEGTAVRRLQVENCLYALTRSPALLAGMVADVEVLTGDRYYGPPFRPVHNHGLMANLAMFSAGKLADRPDWARLAVDRILAEAPLSFSAQGVTHEQSSYYQRVNAHMWENAAKRLETLPGYGEAVKQVRATALKAHRAFRHMTEPDGGIVLIGDSETRAGAPGDKTDRPILHDDEAGWIIGRSSWTDPDATYYTVRYGPQRRAHGHENRAGGVTWTALGVRVIVGTGRYSYNTRDEKARYRLTPESQNVAAPAGAKVAAASTSTAVTNFGRSQHRIQVNDNVYGTQHRRDITVSPAEAHLTVTDAFSVAGWSQHWHLDPAWKRVPGTQDFRHPSGRRLTVSTTGRLSDVWRGDKARPYGWVFPKAGQQVPAYQLKIDSVAGAPVRTTFQLS
ncbi:hypothetical protein OHA21_17485 [Actinoplanes sp. NBC_00393]|uniref:hypothetical protein n=1 Tax=Actinoplanes sp. NBC_00393 TaxID=2975953 RepID=UPI002E1DD9DC